MAVSGGRNSPAIEKMLSSKETDTMSGPVKGFLVFIVWTLTSFVCHYAAKQFLTTITDISGEDAGLSFVIILTFAQISTCFTLLNVPFLTGFTFDNAENLFVVITSHILATTATNYSMTLVQADATFAIKLMEPITSALIAMVVKGTTLTVAAYFSLPLIVVGAVGFIGNPLANVILGMGAWFAFLSNVILAVRNLGIKFMNKEKQFHFRPFHMTLSYSALISSIGFWLYMEFSSRPDMIYCYICLVVSATFHVIYSYVSTCVVLQYLSVVSHSVANIGKRILVVLLLYAVGQRQASLHNVLFLLLCIVGLFVYVFTQSKVNKSTDKEVTVGTRRRLKLVLGLLICLAFATSSVPFKETNWKSVQVFQSARDLLEYDGQDPSVAPPTGPVSNYQDNPKYKDFFSWRLIDHPNETDVLAPHLTSTFEVLKEAKRVTLSVASDIFGHYRYAFLLDMANFENKGDPAINMGELKLLQALNIEVLFNCNIGNCTDKTFAIAKNISKQYKYEEIVVLCSGGGNMGGYPGNDYLRLKIFKTFPEHKVVIFPQSTWFHDQKHLNFSKKIYSYHKDLTIMLRDRESYEFVKKNFPKPKSLLVPDAALSIGPVKRFMPPIYDILWLRRGDSESPKYKIPQLPKNITVMISDWWSFRTPSGKNVMENTFLYTTTGFMFILRGRVYITDRLHGHIFGVLLNIPHVIIDNKIKKITNFHKCWTAGLENVRVAVDAEDALKHAIDLLKQYDAILPRPVAYMRSKP